MSMRRGYVTLLSVLVMGAVGTAIATSLLLLGLGQSRTGLAYQQSAQAKGLANACAAEALQQIRSSTAYSGTGGLTLGQGTCTYTVTKLTGQNRTVTASGTVGIAVRKVSISITSIVPLVTISTWQEVAD